MRALVLVIAGAAFGAALAGGCAESPAPPPPPADLVVGSEVWLDLDFPISDLRLVDVGDEQRLVVAGPADFAIVDPSGPEVLDRGPLRDVTGEPFRSGTRVVVRELRGEVVFVRFGESWHGPVGVYARDGAEVWTLDVAAPSSTTCLDLDGDGAFELVVEEDDVLLCLDHDGRELWRADGNAVETASVPDGSGAERLAVATGSELRLHDASGSFESFRVPAARRGYQNAAKLVPHWPRTGGPVLLFGAHESGLFSKGQRWAVLDPASGEVDGVGEDEVRPFAGALRVEVAGAELYLSAPIVWIQAPVAGIEATKAHLRWTSPSGDLRRLEVHDLGRADLAPIVRLEPGSVLVGLGERIRRYDG